MPLSTVTAGQEILATDINSHIAQTNTNTTNITTNTTNITANTASIATHTTQIGTINTTLAGYNNVPNDTHLSSTGGNLSVNTISVTKNSITRISTFSGTGNATVAHGLGDVPDLIMLTYAGNFGTAPTQALSWYSAGATNVSVNAEGGYFWTGLAIKF